MKRIAATLLALGLAGCNAGAVGGPDLRAQTQPLLAPAWQHYQTNLEAASRHKMTYVQAATRFRDEATATAGAQLTGPDRVVIAYMAALAAEVDGHRMTPETMAFRVQEKLAQNDADQQQANDERQRAATAARLQAVQAYSAYLNATRPPPVVEAQPFAWPMPPVIGGQRLQTNCTSTQLGGFTNTTCN